VTEGTKGKDGAREDRSEAGADDRPGFICIQPIKGGCRASPSATPCARLVLPFANVIGGRRGIIKGLKGGWEGKNSEDCFDEEEWLIA